MSKFGILLDFCSISDRSFARFKKTYKLRGEIGRGGFGVVYRAVRLSDELGVAVKFIDRRSVREWGKVSSLFFFLSPLSLLCLRLDVI